MVTDYDCWYDEAGEVDVAEVLKVMQGNTVKAKALLTRLTASLSGRERTPAPDGIETVLDTALITAPSARDPDKLAELRVIAGRVL